jgi:hypothetical protein
MMIAFASIILGLSVTFFLYCQRGKEESLFSVKVAQQRMALHAALNYCRARLDASVVPTTPVSQLFYAATLYGEKLETANIRSKRAGWFRIAWAEKEYVTTMTLPTPLSTGLEIGSGSTPTPYDSVAGTGSDGLQTLDLIQLGTSPADPKVKHVAVIITAGYGPSGGLQQPTSGNNFSYDDELRNWYLAIFGFHNATNTAVGLLPAKGYEPYLVNLLPLSTKPDSSHW